MSIKGDKKERKIRKKGITLLKLLVVLCVLVVLYQIGNNWYMAEKKKYYSEKTAYVQSLAALEKDWIKENQTNGGAIYMNYDGTPGKAGDVNPYFACLAARGLLAGTPGEEDLDCVKDYLLWHREHFLMQDGEIENYTLTDGELSPVGEMDSVDSYTAVFLSLLCRYGSMGNDLEEIDPGQEALTLGLDKLRSLTENGLTKVESGSEIYYLMDNVEVLAAYYDLQSYVNSDAGISWLGKEQEVWAKKAEEAVRQSEEAIQGQLWNEEENRYEIGLGEGGRILNFSGWDSFYPDAVAQIYPTAFGVSFSDIDNKELYRTFCSNFEWEKMEFEDAKDFNWPVLSYIAAVMGDVDRAYTYLEEYRGKTSSGREYPLYTTDAAWIVRTCARMEDIYMDKMEKSLLDELFSKVRGNGYGEQ